VIKELRFLVRAVLVVDGEGVVRYIQIVRELGSGPDYEAALDAARGR
jgi:thiol peroxidase